MRNLARINYYNNIAARNDWAVWLKRYPDLCKLFDPGPDASWRKIDKAISKVRAAIAKGQQ